MGKTNRKPPLTQAYSVNCSNPPKHSQNNPSFEVLQALWRKLDDAPTVGTIGTYPAQIVAETGDCKLAIAGSTAPIPIPRGSLVVAVRNAEGRIHGLQLVNGRWLTKPQPHFSNLKRSTWTRTLEVFPSSLTATVEAAKRNIATVGRNGASWETLQAVADQLNASLVIRSERRFAPVAIDAPERSEAAA